MNVISCFNGMGCIWIALDRLGIRVDKRYSSEIDKYANIVNDANYPDTIQLGDITKWKEWAIDWSKIDLIVGGSPCQGFSFAGKGLNFEDPRSKLFFVFVEIIEHCKKFNSEVKFLLENVRMKEEHEKVITWKMQVKPIMINSALVSAQNRVRLYWTNINEKPFGLFGDLKTDIPQPKDKGILLKHILESEVNEKYFLTQKALEYVTNEERMKKGYTAINGDKGIGLNAVGTWNNTGTLITESIKNEKATTIDASYYKGFGVRSGKCRQVVEEIIKIDKKGNIKANQNKAGCLCGGGHSGGNHSDMDLIIQKSRGFNKGSEKSVDSKCHTLSSNSWEHNNHLQTNSRIRRLTPVECERLQTVPDNYTKSVSDTQRYRMLGNGWTVDVIVHILSYL